MFEEQTFESIMERMLSKASDDIDKRRGSILWDIFSSFALELENVYIGLDIFLNECFADTASWSYLLRRAAERGLFPKEETQAILKGRFSPSSIDIPIGQVFNLEELNYTVISKIEDGYYQLRCNTAGTIGNQYFGTLIPVQPVKEVSKLEKAELIELLIPGEDMIDMERFRNDYFSSFHSQPFGGNRADYQQKLEKIQGVGGKKILRRKKGEKQIKIIIMDSTYSVPSDTLIAEVQKIIDPNQDQEGDGLAAIGQEVSILGVEVATIDIVTQIIYQTGYQYEDMKEKIEISIDNYFMELRKNWENTERLIIRISQIESRLLNLEGILDIKTTILNGNFENITLQEEQIPERGKIDVN